MNLCACLLLNPSLQAHWGIGTLARTILLQAACWDGDERKREIQRYPPVQLAAAVPLVVLPPPQGVHTRLSSAAPPREMVPTGQAVQFTPAYPGRHTADSTAPKTVECLPNDTQQVKVRHVPSVWL